MISVGRGFNGSVQQLLYWDIAIISDTDRLGWVSIILWPLFMPWSRYNIWTYYKGHRVVCRAKIPSNEMERVGLGRGRETQWPLSIYVPFLQQPEVVFYLSFFPEKPDFFFTNYSTFRWSRTYTHEIREYCFQGESQHTENSFSSPVMALPNNLYVFVE